MLGVVLDEHFGWLVVVTEAGRDHVAERNLKRSGWRVYFPCYRKLLAGVRIAEDGHRIRTRSVGDLVHRPLFPGYGFVAWDATTQWRGMKDAAGVLGFLLNGERPGLVSDGIVEGLRQAVDAGEFDDVKPGRKEPRKDIQPGNIVTLTTGPFAAFRARLEGVDENNRARVLLDLFNAPGRLLKDVDADTLQLAEAGG